jgi:hypothetical protein
MHRLALALLLTLCAAVAFAQAGAAVKPVAPPAMPAAQPAAAATKHGCKQPEYPGRLAPERVFKEFNADMVTYKDCLQKFTVDQRAQAQVYIDAGNAAVAEYNEFVASINKLLEKDTQDPKAEKK